jgi:hypothetical protein
MPTTLFHYTQPVRILLIARDGLSFATVIEAK